MRSPLLEKIPTIIKTMVADDNMLYVGTSQGMVVAIPIDSLSKESAKPADLEEAEGAMGAKDSASGGINSTYLDNCALALHLQKDSRVKSLLHLQLPVQHQSEVDNRTSSSYESKVLPTHSQESDVDAAAVTLLSGGFQSLIVSAGKGHMEYSADKDAEDTLKLPPDYNSLREKDEEHQLLVWGHKLH